MDEINAAVDQGIEVCLAHGDLNCTNVLLSKTNDQVWLLDWEQSDASAPILTDQYVWLWTSFGLPMLKTLLVI